MWLMAGGRPTLSDTASTFFELRCCKGIIEEMNEAEIEITGDNVRTLYDYLSPRQVGQVLYIISKGYPNGWKL